MIEFYPQIKWLHVAMVMASGTLFAMRGLLVLLGRPGLAMAAVPRYLSYAIDTTLLTAALMLLTILPGAMFANGWLATKLVLLVVYVGLGTFALKRGRSPRVRLGCYLAALVTFAFIYSVARAHHPGGIAWLLLSAA
ncbi:MAG TPA: SirB2 family protein [Luteimonas sp.]